VSKKARRIYKTFALPFFFYKEKKTCSGMERTGKNVYEIPERYKAKFKSGTVLNRACEAYGDYLKEEANNKDDEYEEGEEE